MLIEKELSVPGINKDTILTIGVFDGVHLGHKQLISRVKQEAKNRQVLSGVITFNRHPVEIINPEASFSYLVSLEEKIRLLNAEQVDFVIPLTFDKELSSLGADDFLRLLQDYVHMSGLFIGPDFCLGRNREGNVENIIRFGSLLGFKVTVIPPLLLDGEIVSSTAIRQALIKGDMAKVTKLTGRPYSISGRVTSGTGLGRTLGYPTANLLVEPGFAMPADGVYATYTHVNGYIHKSMTSIGVRPTFGGKNRTIETLILDYEGDLYNRDISIEIIDRLREEKKFNSAEELKLQIMNDIEKGRELLSSKGPLSKNEKHIRHD